VITDVDLKYRVNHTVEDVRMDPRVTPAADSTTICPVCKLPVPEPSPSFLGQIITAEQEGLPRLRLHVPCVQGWHPMRIEQIYVAIFAPLMRAAERRAFMGL
jgi:hypothetical protein